MKKISKFLAILMAVVVFASVFAIVPSAISSTSSKSKILKYYENCLNTTAKRGLVKADNTWKYTVTGDYSNLSAKDAQETKELNDEFFGADGCEENVVSYFYGTSDKEYYVEGKPDIVWMFSVDRRIKEFDLVYKSAKLTTASNGDVTIVFNLLEEWEDYTCKITITTKTAKDGCLKYFVMKQESTYTDISVAGVEYPLAEVSVDTYKIKYKKVPVTSIELSETSVKMCYDETYTISVTVNPSNATFKDFYCIIPGKDVDVCVADYSINEDGTITLYALEPGTTVLEVYSYDGNKVAECEVAVEFTFFQLIAKFFRDLFASIRDLFIF